MADKSKPEELDDQDLDQAQGGFGSWGEPVGTVKANPKRREGFNGHQGDEPAMIKSDKPIVAEGGGSGI